MTVQEKNKIIAEFMGYTQPHPDYPEASYWYKEGEPPLCFLTFQSDWNWIMKVVVECFNRYDYMGDISIHGNHQFLLNDALLETNIDSLHKAVFEFIQWYNLNKIRQ
jgi:hypothetical protein